MAVKSHYSDITEDLNREIEETETTTSEEQAIVKGDHLLVMLSEDHFRINRVLAQQSKASYGIMFLSKTT